MQIIFNGTVNGLTLAVLAVAFVTVYLPTRIFFIALAGIYSVTPFVVRSALGSGISAPFAVALGLAFGTGLSLAMEIVNHRPLRSRAAGEGAHLVSSLGLFILITQGTALVWGKSPQTLRQGVDLFFRVGPVVATRAQLLAGSGALLLLLTFYLVQKRSRLGVRLRAMASNPDLLGLLGHDTARLSSSAFAVSGFLASSASLLTAFNAGFDPFRGLNSLLMAIVAMIIGGRHSFLGPVLGALALGLVRTASIWFFSAQWQEVITFALLASFLVFRPEGFIRGIHRPEASA